MDRLKDKVALVTGAASGIGRATALLFAREGARVVATDIATLGEQVARDIRAGGGQGLFLLHDVTDEVAWHAVMSRTLEAHGRLDILVNNAGISTSRAVTELSLAEWREQLAVNLDGVFLGIKYAVRAMRAGKREGSIVNVASVSGLVASIKCIRCPSINACVVSCAIMSCDRQVKIVCPGRFATGSVSDAGK